MEKDTIQSQIGISNSVRNQRGRTSFTKSNNYLEFEMGRIPPQALDIEEAVLGSLLLEKNALSAVIDMLRPEVFYKEAHQYIYGAIADLFADSEPVDLITVMSKLRATGMLDIVGGPYYLTQLTHKVASAANIEFYAKIIIEKYVQRQLISTSTEIVRDAYEDTTDVFELLDKAESKLFSISENNFRREFEPLPGLIKRTLGDIEASKNSDGMRGVPSGYSELDRITGGWQKTDLIIVAARPGMGKTAFALSMARNMAVDFKKPVAVFSLEMDANQLAVRLMSAQTNIKIWKLRRGLLSDDEWLIFHERLSGLSDAPIYIDDTPALSIFELRAKCRRMKEQYHVEAIMVDYLQLMTGTSEAKGIREQEISGISRGLKSMAKELEVPVIVLSQLNRSVETRGGSKKPMLSDLRESGAIEQDADLVLFVYRPERYDIDSDEKGDTAGMADIIIAKHRNGATDSVRLRFMEEYTKFTELETTAMLDTSMHRNEQFDSEGDTGGFVLMKSKMDEPRNNDYNTDFLPEDDGTLDF